MENYDDKFIEGETYEKDGKSFLVMAVDTIDDEEAWLAILWVDADGNSGEADEICIKESDYDNWKIREFN